MSVFHEFKPKVELSKQEFQDLVFDCVHKTMLFVSSEYQKSNLSEFRKDQIRTYLASEPILKIEASINQQYALAVAGDLVAFDRVREGMDYWKQLVMRKMAPL